MPERNNPDERLGRGHFDRDAQAVFHGGIVHLCGPEATCDQGQLAVSRGLQFRLVVQFANQHVRDEFDLTGPVLEFDAEIASSECRAGNKMSTRDMQPPIKPCFSGFPSVTLTPLSSLPASSPSTILMAAATLPGMAGPRVP
ncbi:hypothetical protein [Amycolatopsis sp. NPDC049159]|uniref:hypothetical protein n=1 Tax=Amycolatopsis sp. NPDC049159 TaxID=3157210 RepID=UPI0033C9474E